MNSHSSADRAPDLIVVGAEAAGCAAALAAAQLGCEVLLLAKAKDPSDTDTAKLREGVVGGGQEDDADHFRGDILQASDEIREASLDLLLAERDSRIGPLVSSLGFTIPSYHSAPGHSRARVVIGDGALGRHLHDEMIQKVRANPRITLVSGATVFDLIVQDEAVFGAYLIGTEEELTPLFAKKTILATGGIGGLFPRSTGSSRSTGDGIALALRAGAEAKHAGRIQFHPLFAGVSTNGVALPLAFLSEGARLLNGKDEELVIDAPDPNALAKLVREETKRTGEVVLDLHRTGAMKRGEREYPELTRDLRASGIDLRESRRVPVRVAQELMCGGIVVDTSGRSRVQHLYVVGDASWTGICDSWSIPGLQLLESLIWGSRSGEDAARAIAAMRPEPLPALEESLPCRDDPLPAGFCDEKFRRLEEMMWASVGLHQRQSELPQVVAALRALKGEVESYNRFRVDAELVSLRNACWIALLCAKSALEDFEHIEGP